jgi:hypothetical protein
MHVCYGKYDQVHPLGDIEDYYKNVHKMTGPIECTSMVTRIAINLGCPEMANLSYIEGDVPDLGLDHFVHAHICKDRRTKRGGVNWAFFKI